MNKVRLYIAAPFELQMVGRELRDLLQQTHRYAVVARWLDEDPSATIETLSGEEAGVHAIRDLEDIGHADGLLVLNPESFRYKGTGGRHVELGYAIARHYPIFILGMRTNVFHHHSLVKAVTPDPLVLLKALNLHWRFFQH